MSNPLYDQYCAWNTRNRCAPPAQLYRPDNHHSDGRKNVLHIVMYDLNPNKRIIVSSATYRHRQLSSRCSPSLLLQISRPGMSIVVLRRCFVASEMITYLLSAGLALAAWPRARCCGLAVRLCFSARARPSSTRRRYYFGAPCERAVFMILSPPRASHALRADPCC